MLSVRQSVICSSGGQRQGRLLRVRRQASEVSVDTKQVVSLPSSPQLQVEEVKRAIYAAYENGVTKQSVQMLLPLIGATDLDDWPGGIRQQFKAARPMVDDILTSIRQKLQFDGKLKGRMLDDGDAVGAWSNDFFGLILFPTAEALKPIKEITKDKKLMMFVNPQWQGGQVISDFGFGPWKQRNEEFVNQFEPTFVYKQIRISGDNVRILKSYPNKWQLHWIDPTNGSDLCIRVSDEQLSYREMEEALRGVEGARINMSLANRLKSEAEFNQRSLTENREQ